MAEFDRGRRDLERAKHLVDLALQPIGPELELWVRDLERRGDLAGLELLESGLRLQASSLLKHTRGLAKKLGMIADFDALWDSFTVYEWLWLRHRLAGVSVVYTDETVPRLVSKRMVHEGEVTPLGQRFCRWVTPRAVTADVSRDRGFMFEWRGVLFTGEVVPGGERWSVHSGVLGHVAIQVDPSYWCHPGAERFGRGVLTRGPRLEPYLLYATDLWVQAKSGEAVALDRLGESGVDHGL